MSPLLYPQYYKDSSEAKAAFLLIDQQEEQRRGTASPLRRISVRVDKLSDRKVNELEIDPPRQSTS